MKHATIALGRNDASDEHVFSWIFRVSDSRKFGVQQSPNFRMSNLVIPPTTSHSMVNGGLYSNGVSLKRRNRQQTSELGKRTFKVEPCEKFSQMK